MKTTRGTKTDLRQWLQGHDEPAPLTTLQAQDYYRGVVAGYTVDTRDYERAFSRVLDTDRNGLRTQSVYRAGEHYVVYERTVVGQKQTFNQVLRRILTGRATQSPALSQGFALTGLVSGFGALIGCLIVGAQSPLFVLSGFALLVGLIPVATEYEDAYARGVYRKDVRVIEACSDLCAYLGNQTLDELPPEFRPPELT